MTPKQAVEKIIEDRRWVWHADLARLAFGTNEPIMVKSHEALVQLDRILNDLLERLEPPSRK